MKKHLTDITVKKLSNSLSGQVTYWDETTPGFGLRCSPKSKSFVVMYGKRRQLKTIGRYPEISLSDARKVAKTFLSEVSQDKHTVSTLSPAYEEAVEMFLKDCDSRLRPITVREYRRHLKFFGFNKRLDEIRRKDALNKLGELRATPTNQNYAFTALKVFFNWAIRNELCTSHPISADKKPAKLKSRERILSDSEMAALYGYVRNNSSLFSDLVALLILTGQRKSEISKMRWEEIREGCLDLSGERTKNHRAHRLPLPSVAVRILEDRIGNGDYVFPGRNPEQSYNGFRRAKGTLDRDVGIAHFTLHDLRRTFSSNMAKIGVPIHVTEKILNHQSGTFSGVVGIYNRHSYFSEMKVALRKHEEFLEDLIGNASK